MKLKLTAMRSGVSDVRSRTTGRVKVVLTKEEARKPLAQRFMKGVPLCR